MEIIEAPLPRFPNTCVLTGRDDGPVLDTNIETQGTAHIYIRLTKLEEMAEFIGMVPKAEVDKLQASLDELASELAEAQKLLAAYQQVAEGEKALAEIVSDHVPDPVPEVPLAA